MHNAKEPQSCWEYWNCLKEVRDKCLAYTSNSGKDCWMVVGNSITEFNQCPKLGHEFKNCWECPWFQKMNPDFDKNRKKLKSNETLRQA